MTHAPAEKPPIESVTGTQRRHAALHLTAPRVAELLLILLVSALAATWPRLDTGITRLFADRAQLAAMMRGAGAWGPLLLIGLTAAQVIVAPIPGQALNFVGGYLYGFWAGALYSWLGLLLGSLLAMSLARLAGRPLVERLVDRSALARFDHYAAGQGLLFFFLVFLIPFLPDDLACYAAGLTALPLPALFGAAALGRLPGLVTATWLGAHAENLAWPIWSALALATAAGLLLAWRCGSRIQAALMRRAQ